jgi:isoquinoline 1-oxidoreductase beta subunit
MKLVASEELGADSSCPGSGRGSRSVGDQAALAEPGVVAVVPMDEGAAVVGDTVADVQRGLRALVVE